MHVRVRLCGKPESIVVVPSKLTKIEKFRVLLEDKFGIEPKLQRLFYGGKLLDNGYSFHDYNIKLNDVIQLMIRISPPPEKTENPDADSKSEDTSEKVIPKIEYEDAVSKLFKVGDLVDIRERVHNAWFEGKIVQIVKDPEYVSKKSNPSSRQINGTPKSNKKYDILKTETSNSPVNDKKTPNKKGDGNSSKNDIDASSKTPCKNDGAKSPSKEIENAQSPIKKGKESSSSTSPCGTPKSTKSPTNKTPKRDIMDYFSRGKVNNSPGENSKTNGIVVNGNSKEEKNVTNDKLNSTNGTSDNDEQIDEDSDEEVGLLYKAFFEEEEENSAQYCKLSEIRPRARKEILIEDVKPNQTVLLNYNIEEPHEKGFWYDFKIQEVKKLRKNTELVGTLYHGKDVPLNDVKVKIQDKIYAIESVVPLNKRSAECDTSMVTATEKRSGPLVCTKCRDDPETPCKECGCNVCAGKNPPEQIILCDECNLGYHLLCLQPPLSDLPSEDWYCAECKRDPTSVVAPGGKAQVRKPNQHKTRDWGRGMACVGKTQTCAMPANHFGPIPGIEVGMAWRFRIQLSESGVHRPPVSGIHGRDVEGAYSIVLSGGYEDDVDHGFEFTYTGSGGRDLSGNKRTADQSSDQTLTRENKALARNCAVKEVKEEGADSGNRWREGKPVRVVRSYKMIKHFPEYAPKEGIRYDGIYKIVKYYPEKGKSGFRVWKYLLRRDDPSPAPWEENGKKFPIKYPDGYLEAEAEKQAQKEREKLKNCKSPSVKKTRKRPLRESNGAEDSGDEKETKKRKSRSAKDASPPPKKMKTRSSIVEEKEVKASKTPTPKRKKLDKSAEKVSSPKVNPFTIAASKKITPQNDENELVVLSSEDKKAIEEDTANKKLWEECLSALDKDGKKGLVDKVGEVFLCIICQDVVANPVTTSCCHNFCMACLRLAFKSTDSNCCPHCRNDLSKEEPLHNEKLKVVLRSILPGYDLHKK